MKQSLLGATIALAAALGCCSARNPEAAARAVDAQGLGGILRA